MNSTRFIEPIGFTVFQFYFRATTPHNGWFLAFENIRFVFLSIPYFLNKAASMKLAKLGILKWFCFDSFDSMSQQLFLKVSYSNQS